MRRLLARKKSVPRIGTLTSARINRCTTLSPGSKRENVLLPNVLMEDPLAAQRDAELLALLRAGEAGKTETSAPLSIRKDRRKRRQKTESEPS